MLSASSSVGSCSTRWLTRQLTRMSLSSRCSNSSGERMVSSSAFWNKSPVAVGGSIVPSSLGDGSFGGYHPSPQTTFSRSLATNRKVLDAKNVKRLKTQAKKKKNKQPASSSSGLDDEVQDDTDSSSSQPFLQHQEWVKFQQQISVDGFQTGQVTSATTLSALKKSRGGKQARKRRELEAAATATTKKTSSSSTKFPAIRYGPEETQELLNLAFATLPERTGKRGTRSKNRQAQRWKQVRRIRATYKHHISQAHERRMEARHEKRQRVLQVKQEAVGQRRDDLNYQAQILQTWASTMMNTPENQLDSKNSNASPSQTAQD